MISDDILESNLPDDEYCRKVLLEFFPSPIKDKYSKYVFDHSLKKEIIATRLSNDLVNEVGFTFSHRLKQETGANSAEIVKAYLVSKEIIVTEHIQLISRSS